MEEIGDPVLGWKSREISQWLESVFPLRSKELKKLFIANHVDGEILLTLSENDLQQIGVVSVGLRRKLFLKISRLKEKELSLHRATPDCPFAVSSGDEFDAEDPLSEQEHNREETKEGREENMIEAEVVQHQHDWEERQKGFIQQSVEAAVVKAIEPLRQHLADITEQHTHLQNTVRGCEAAQKCLGAELARLRSVQQQEQLDSLISRVGTVLEDIPSRLMAMVHSHEEEARKLWGRIEELSQQVASHSLSPRVELLHGSTASPPHHRAKRASVTSLSSRTVQAPSQYIVPRSSASLQMLVKLPLKTVTVRLPVTSRVSALKNVLHERENIPLPSQRLVVNGHELVDDDALLLACGVTPDVTLECFFKASHTEIPLEDVWPLLCGLVKPEGTATEVHMRLISAAHHWVGMGRSAPGRANAVFCTFFRSCAKNGLFAHELLLRILKTLGPIVSHLKHLRRRQEAQPGVQWVEGRSYREGRLALVTAIAEFAELVFTHHSCVCFSRAAQDCAVGSQRMHFLTWRGVSCVHGCPACLVMGNNFDLLFKDSTAFNMLNELLERVDVLDVLSFEGKPHLRVWCVLGNLVELFHHHKVADFASKLGNQAALCLVMFLFYSGESEVGRWWNIHQRLQANKSLTKWKTIRLASTKTGGAGKMLLWARRLTVDESYNLAMNSLLKKSVLLGLGYLVSPSFVSFHEDPDVLLKDLPLPSGNLATKRYSCLLNLMRGAWKSHPLDFVIHSIFQLYLKHHPSNIFTSMHKELTSLRELLVRYPRRPEDEHASRNMAAGIQRTLSYVKALEFKNVSVCPVCLEPPNDPVVTSCRHTFCRGCFETAFDYDERCPVCRRSMVVTEDLEEEGVTASLALNQASLSRSRSSNPPSRSHSQLALRRHGSTSSGGRTMNRRR